MLSRTRRSWGTALAVVLLLGTSARAQVLGTASDAPLPACWARADYLLWTVQGSALPALITASPAGTARADAGVFGAKGTEVLFGNQFVNVEMRSGFLVEGGGYFNPDSDEPFGLFGNFFRLGTQSEGNRAISDGSYPLARPFFNENLGRQDSKLVAFPEFLRGQVDVKTTSDLLGAEFSAIQQLLGDANYRVALYIGYRYLRFRDAVRIQEDTLTLAALDALPVPGTMISVLDSFACDTDFHGCNFGIDFIYHYGPFSLGLRPSLAVGYSSQVTRITGQTQVQVPGSAATLSAGGLLALPTNGGEFRRSDAAILTQMGLTVGYAVLDRARVKLGYDFLYLSDAARAGAQIDTHINPTQLSGGTLTGTAKPAFVFQPGELWAQGLRFGVEIDF